MPIKELKYLRTRYSVERDFSIEFENLMDDEIQDDMQKPLTDREKELLNAKKYDAILHEQKRFDAEIEAKLARQEEELRIEEEAYYEAKRESARIAKMQRAKDQGSKSRTAPAGSSHSSWLGDNADDWDVAGGEDDFEMFLASVKARSISARSRQRLGSGDGQSTSSSNTNTKDRTHTEASSIDLEWEHEAGMTPQTKKRSATEENLAGLANRGYTESPNNSNDLEWDNDYVSSQNLETEQLLSKSDRTEKNGNKLYVSDR